MTHPTDYFFHPQPESGQGLHTQESGDAGLSSNMEHRFTDHYYESALPVADKGSFVMPIPKGQLYICDRPAMSRKIWSRPSVSGHVFGPMTHSVSAEEGFIKPAPLAVVQINNFPPQALPEHSLEEKTVKVLPGTTAITEGQPDVEVAGEEGCTKMDTGENPAKPKGPSMDPGNGRNSIRRRKRAATKHRKLYLLGWMALMLVYVSEGFPVSAIGAQPEPAADGQSVKCSTCMDKDRCPKLFTIYDSHLDTLLYKRDLNQTFPVCSEMSPPGSKRCAVCQDQLNITILCSGDVGKLEVEDSDGGQILNISSLCVRQQIPGRGRVGVIVSVVLFLMVVGALLIYSCCQKKRGQKVVSSEEH